MSDEIRPVNHAEAVAIFRAQLIGPLVCRKLQRGEFKEIIKELSQLRVRPPGQDKTRRYSTVTLRRWCYAYRKRGLEGLKPKRRADRGHGRNLTDAQRDLLCDIRREYPRASASLILKTLAAEGRIEKGTVTATTVRRLFADRGLDRTTLSAAPDGRPRRRWQAERPDALWHADVCYGPTLEVGKRKIKLRIHAILDDHSRYIVAIQACSTEREADMLALLVKAVRRYGCPDAFYLDNGPTYSGDTLKVVCARLGITLMHARPYDPQARGKMERWWRTLREGCVNYVGHLASLHDVQVRLLAFVDRHYHCTPHASLMGRTPATVYETGRAGRPVDDLTEKKLRDALTVRGQRLVRKDGTISIGGVEWEVQHGFLAGRRVAIARCLIDNSPPWIEYEERDLPLRRLDPKANAKRRRPKPKKPKSGLDIAFDPPAAFLDQALGRRPKGGRK